MTKEQEEKFEAWYANQTAFTSWSKEILRDGWKYCLEANGIGDTTESAAPHWVIDMMRTGKPVRCRCWSDRILKRECNIVSMVVTDINGLERGYRFIDDEYNWYQNAEPIPAWKPKDGEAVLTRVFDHAETGYVKGGFMYVRNNRLAIEGAECKPFDESKLGWLWSEV